VNDPAVEGGGGAEEEDNLERSLGLNVEEEVLNIHVKGK
jgi:hypothetical protein